jgi:alkylation response protein AidB-like acyl-CoA dehydrogenase
VSVAELFAPPPDVAAHPAVDAARLLATELLAPHAAEADIGAGVRRDHLEAIAAEGLLGTPMPVELGGLGAPVGVDREVQELLAGACGATWLVSAQHRRPVELVSHSDNPAVRERWLGPLCSARTLAGVAFTHARRPGAPAVTARPDGAGWLLDGTVSWCTGWGLLDVLVVAGQADDGRLVFALTPMTAGPGIAAEPLELSVMGGTRTVALRLDGLAVAPEDVVLVADRAEWLAADIARTTNATPGSLGLLRSVIVALGEASPAAAALAVEAVSLRHRAYALVDDVPPEERTGERADLRAALADLTLRAVAALVTARSGRAMLRTSDAQRWAREAMFHLVQGTSEPVRAAMLRQVTAP